MSRVIVICCFVFLCAGCTGYTVTVRPITTTRKPIHHHPVNKSKPASSTVVDHDWMVQYRQLESEHGDYKIADDSKCEPTHDGKFRVTRAMLEHFRDLSVSPVSTPTPASK